MPTKAPIPPGVAALTFLGRQGLTTWELEFTLFVPGSESADYASLRDLWGGVSFAFADVVNDCMAGDTFLDACRLELHHVIGRVVVFDSLQFQGGHDASVPAPVCSVSTWSTSTAGRRGHPITHLPGVPVEWSEDGWQLTSVGRATTAARLADFRNTVSTLTSVAFPVVELCSLRRTSAGVALDRADVVLLDVVQTRQRLGTIAHRLRTVRVGPTFSVP